MLQFAIVVSRALERLVRVSAPVRRSGTWKRLSEPLSVPEQEFGGLATALRLRGGRIYKRSGRIELLGLQAPEVSRLQ